MNDDPLALIADEIERLRRRYRSYLREVPGAREAAARWTITGATLRWHVSLEDILEPDIDIEITRDAILVRGRPQSARRTIILSVLTVPPGFDAQHARVHFESGYLEVRVLRVGSERP